MSEWKPSGQECMSCLVPQEWEERGSRSTEKFVKNGEWFMCPICDRPEIRSPVR